MLSSQPLKNSVHGKACTRADPLQAPKRTASAANQRLHPLRATADPLDGLAVESSSNLHETTTSVDVSSLTGHSRATEHSQTPSIMSHIDASMMEAPAASGMLSPSLVDPMAFVWASVVLFAIRVTRRQLDAESYFERRRKLILDGPISASKDLLEKRRQYELLEASRQKSMSAERVAAAAGRALQEGKKRAAERKKYVEEAEKEAARLKETMEAQRKEYEAREAALRAEYEARVEQERQLREAAAAAARAKEEEQRRIEQERKAALAAEQARREAEERAAREAERLRRLEEKQRLAKEKQHFVATFDATCQASKPPQGTIVEGRLPKPAVLAISCSFGSVLTSEQSFREAVYARTTDAREDASRLAGECAKAQCDAYTTSMRLQSMMEQGPLAFLDELEFKHWMNCTAVRCGSAAWGKLLEQLDALGKGNPPKPAAFKLRTEWAALAVDHPSSLPSQFSNAISLFEEDKGEQAMSNVLEELIEDTRKELQQGLPQGVELLPYAAEALVWAQLLDRMLESRPAKQAAAPAWFDQAGSLAAEHMKELVRDAPKDSLEPVSLMLSSILGVEHPLARIMQERAVKNMSKQIREAREQRAMLAEAEIAAKLLEEEWPDYKQLAEARREEQEANTPMPERVWALRNVARTLALGGPGEKKRARGLLEQAVGLKQVYCGGPDHPGALPELMSLYNLLATVAEWQDEAKAAAKDALKLFTVVAERYTQQSNALAATVLLEAAVRQFEDVIGFRDPAVSSATRRAEQLYETLDSDDRALVASKRGPPEGARGILDTVANWFTEDLQVYATPGSSSKVQQWEEKGASMLPSLV